MALKRNSALTSKTSRPFTKALGATSILGLAIMSASSAYAMKTEIGVDYLAKAYSIHSNAWEGNATADDNPADIRDNGFANLLRVNTNFIDEDTGVSIHTRLELSGDRWQGDALDYNTGSSNSFNADNRGSLVSLDLGYAQIPLPGKAILRVGRQEANWNNGFLVSDDRRDRILGIVPTSIGTVLALYDRRGDQEGFFSNDNGDMGALGLITKVMDYQVGLLWVHWLNNHTGASQGYVLQGMDIFSPYLTGSVAGLFDLTAGMNYVGNNQINEYAPGVPYSAVGADGLVFSDSSFSEYVRAEKTLGDLDLGLQWVGAQDGGLISSGFDTYSSMINSSPESTSNPTSVYRMGGKSGRKDYNESLLIGKVGFNLTPQWKLTGAAGSLMVDNGTNNDSSLVLDVEASYQVNKAVRVWATAGYISSNEVATLSGNPLVASGPFTTSADPTNQYYGNNTGFADNNVTAGSVNMQVKF